MGEISVFFHLCFFFRVGEHLSRHFPAKWCQMFIESSKRILLGLSG